MKHQPLNINPLPELRFDQNRKRVKFCPCGLENNTHFVPYIGYEDKGYCHSCDKTFLPESSPDLQIITYQPRPKITTKIDYIPLNFYLELISRHKNLNSENNFLKWLGNAKRGSFAFSSKTVETLIELYNLGNTPQYAGWVMFPYIDIEGRVTDIKAMDYNCETGKRIKKPEQRCKFIGKEVLKNWKANTVRCFYGEMLLKGNNKPVKLFESEATTSYAAAFFPDSICLATGGQHGCRWTDYDKCSVLKGRDITLYPDLDGHEAWEQKAEMLRTYGLNVNVSHLIINSALAFSEQSGIAFSELVKGKYDLRDFLQFKDLSEFLKLANSEKLADEIEHEEFEEPDPSFLFKKSTVLECTIVEPIDKEPENWNSEIEALENFFKTATIPEQLIGFQQCNNILNVSAFIESQFDALKFNNGNPTFLPFLKRLIELKRLL
jgi:hypothetical protein